MNKILYFGHYYLPEIVSKRKLSTRNIAAYNRMKRFAEALEYNKISVHIVSPGVCMYCGFYKKIVHKEYRKNEGAINVTTIPAIGIPILGMLFEPFLLIAWTLRYVLHSKIRCVLIYNYSPSFLLLAGVLKLLGIRIFSQIEDISVPRVDDWKRGSETRPFQQVILFVCMHLLVFLSDGTIVPTKRFLSIISRGKKYLVVNGCVPFVETQKSVTLMRSPNDKIDVLFAGKYEREHGLDLLVEVINQLNTMPKLAERFIFHCCGTSKYPEELSILSAQSNSLTKIELHGFIDDNKYRELLDHIQIALVLQKSKGRHANFKTPSKAYEFLAAGKIVIATDIGDLSDLAPDKLVCLRDETAETLLSILSDIVMRPQRYESIAREALIFCTREYTYGNVGNKLLSFLLNFSTKK